MNFANPNIQVLKSYSPPLAGRGAYEGTLLDFNERTVPPSAKVFVALQDFLNGKKLNIYPEYFDFCECIAQYAQIDPAQIMITNGSDQGIDLIFRTFTQRNDDVIIPSPSFAMFYQCAGIMENNIKEISYVLENGSFPFNQVLESITPRTKLIVLCNPNNPTGTSISLGQIETILQHAPHAIVYVDEAYYEFSGITATPLIKKYSNLMITRTFSKAFGLASLRVGYVISQEHNIQQLLKVRGPYDVNTLGYHAAKAALEDIEDLEKYVDEVMNVAKPMVENFFCRNGIPFFKSTANFLLFRPKTDVQELYTLLRKNGFLVRPQSAQQIEGMLRVSIGTEEQMGLFIKTFSSLL